MNDEAKTLDQAAALAVDTALDPDRFQELVEKQLTKSMERWISDALNRYNSPASKAFQARMGELLVPAIERMSLDNARLDVMLATLVESTAIGERAEILAKFGRLVGGQQRETVPASEVFEAYAKHVASAYDCDGREVDFDSGEPTYYPLTCRAELDTSSNNGWSDMERAELLLYVEDCDADQVSKINRTIGLHRWPGLPRQENAWYAHYPLQPTLKDLAHASNFDIYLARLDANNTTILWDLGTGEWTDVEPEATPEIDYH